MPHAVCQGYRECSMPTAFPWPRKPQGEGTYGWYSTDQPVPETVGGRPGQVCRDGRNDKREPCVVVVPPPLPRSEGEAQARRRAATRGAALSRTRVCVDRVGAYDDLSEGIFRFSCPDSGTTGVA
jgi:hypothetical protein